MLEELLKHDKLGSKEEILFFLFDSLSANHEQDLKDLQKYCRSHVFSIGHSLSGIIKLCEFVSFIEISREKVFTNKECFNVTSFQKASYFNQFHFFGYLIHSLEKYGVIDQIFNENNLKFNQKLNRYYVLDSQFSYKFFSIRNILLATGFFEREISVANHLLIKEEFTDQFKKCIVDKLSILRNKKRKISLSALKKSLENKEIVGKLAELRVLEYENERLKGHSDIGRVGMISDEYINAGYDIESFDARDSIILDRFIEVKSYEGEISFYWSKNEVEKARELGGKYFIYLVDREIMNEKNFQPKKFQNPYMKIFENELWLKEAETWKMTFKDIS
jgi:hypothetical protein